MKILMGVVLMASAMTGTAASAQVVNIAAVDATKPGAAPTPVTMAFDAGTYTVKVVGIAGGGLYDAWSVATPAANNYDDRYSITDGNGTTQQVSPYNGQRFATATAALDAFSGLVTSFTLAAAGNVTFSIPDDFFYDNTGGVSLGITKATAAPVPEPGTMALFALASGALLAFWHRRKTALQA